MSCERLCHSQRQPCPSWFARALDWVGNQWDKLNALSQVCVAVAGVAICFAAAVAAVG